MPGKAGPHIIIFTKEIQHYIHTSVEETSETKTTALIEQTHPIWEH